MRFMRTIAVSAVIVASAAATAVAVANTQSDSSPAGGMAGMSMPMADTSSNAALPAAQLAIARLATVKYSADLGAAKKAGYSILTQQIAGMGYHYINPKITGAFDVRKPPILVYEKHGARWQLGALEWVFPKKPATAPLQGATYGSFPAACQYANGEFVPDTAQSGCAATSPKSGAKFTFWHPQLVTMHVWLWYPNPSGLYASMNPLVPAFG